MPTLASIDGRSLVGDVNIGDAVLDIFGTRKSRAAEAAAKLQEVDTQDNLDILTGVSGSDEDKQAARLRLAAINPQLEKEIGRVIDSGDEKAIAAAAAENLQGMRDAAVIKAQPDLTSKRRAIQEIRKRNIVQGKPNDRATALMNLGEPELNLQLLMMETAGKNAEQILTPTKAVETFTTETIGGVPVQVSSVSGKETTSPRATDTPKPQTPIGKARSDFQSGFISQADLDLVTTAPPKFQSSVGKLIGDKNTAVSLFGDNSPQVQAIQEAIEGESKGDAVKLSDVAGMRKEFTKLSGDFIDLRDAFGKVESSSKDPSGAGDLSLIFNFMKILDPGSVVRESEFATAQNATSLPGRFGSLANRVVNGQKLNEAQRKDFVDTARKIFSAQEKRQTQLEKSFSGLAESAGIKPGDVVIDFQGKPSKGDKPDIKHTTPPPPPGFEVQP